MASNVEKKTDLTEAASATDTSVSDASGLTDGSHEGVEVPMFGEISVLQRSSCSSDEEDDEEEGGNRRRRSSILTTFTSLLGSFVRSSQDVQPVYGRPLSNSDAADWLSQASSAEGDGLVWHATIVPDASYYTDNGEGKKPSLMKGLNPRDFDLSSMPPKIKPRRGSLPVTVTEFSSSLTRVGNRYIFHGVLNGWPSLQTFELLGIDRKRSSTIADFAPSRLNWQRVWSTGDKSDKELDLRANGTKMYRAKLRAAPWSSVGWSPESPGFMFWYEAQREEGPRVTYGLNATDSVSDTEGDKCTNVHMISHRYAVKKESPKDKVTYHSIVLLEWEHEKYCTVIEAAYLNGIGGYHGRSNWYDDKDGSSPTALYQALPPEMVQPWLTTAAEIRCFDVKAKNLEEIQDFMERYRGADKRFIEPCHSFSHPARLSYRTKRHIARYLVNYMDRDCSYSELRRNCQTFAADLCAFLAGKKEVQPYHPLVRIDYHNRTHMFLYDSGMFPSRGAKNPNGRVTK